MKQRLPIGIQDFAKIREDGFKYVDKTARIHQLLTGSGGVFFLSRPRRFGKSLLCSTLDAVFSARRELFKEIAGQSALAIDSLDWDWKIHPVIRLDLNPGNYANGTGELFATLNRALEQCAQKYEVPYTGVTISDRFARLITALCETYHERVAVIVDEYDKPLLNTIESPEIHTAIRTELKGFYGVLKSSDAYLRFVFLTGVTKFAQVSVFSDLNQIIDISLDSRYADLCGVTQEELEQDFALWIDEIAQDRGKDRVVYLAELKRFYNGYRFSPKPLTVYNPFGLLNHFDQNGEFLSYWYVSGTPTFLITLIEKQHIDLLRLENKTVLSGAFHNYDVENLAALPLLYQTGYLTIVGYDEELGFILDYPNIEVRASFATSLIEQYLHVPEKNRSAFFERFFAALYAGDTEGILNALKPFFASIPYDLIANTENYYQTVVHLIFTMLGLQCRSEVRIAAGRIDTLVETKKFVYCFEFKLNGTAEEALRQIDTKEYLLPWQGTGKQLFKIGVAFDTEKRNIGEWLGSFGGGGPPARPRARGRGARGAGRGGG
ncbi:MAG: ATP-binding protein, partial [Treponema sp.]|nr:ATP-binding protein [Treponema sp.]